MQDHILRFGLGNSALKKRIRFIIKGEGIIEIGVGETAYDPYPVCLVREVACLKNCMGKLPSLPVEEEA